MATVTLVLFQPAPLGAGESDSWLTGGEASIGWPIAKGVKVDGRTAATVAELRLSAQGAGLNSSS